jgi:hypothetical protein
MSEKTKTPFSKGFVITVVIVLGVATVLFWELFTGFMPDAGKVFADIDRQLIAKREAGIKELLPRAKEGDLRAQTALGRLYGQRHTPEDEKEAFAWIRKAAPPAVRIVVASFVPKFNRWGRKRVNRDAVFHGTQGVGSSPVVVV